MIRAINIVTGYGKTPVSKTPLSFDIGAGELILLCGANGSGKTTLMKTLAGLIPPLAGKLTWDGLSSVMVPSRIPKVKGFTVAEFIRTACYRNSGWAERLSKEAEARLDEALHTMELESLRDKDISRISDGEFQKAAIASALVRDSSLILLDEPTAFLDVDNRFMVLEAMKKVCYGSGRSMIFSSHDIGQAASAAGRILGLTKEGGLADSSVTGKSAVLEACFSNKFVIFG